MPLYALHGRDRPAALALRLQHRPEHLAKLERLARAGRLRYAGPLLDSEGNPSGSVVIFEAPDLAAARAIADADPYVVHGVFASFELHETRQVLPAPA